MFQLEKRALRSAAPEIWLCRRTGMSLAKLHMDVPPFRRGESLTQEIRGCFHGASSTLLLYYSWLQQQLYH